MCVRSAEVVHVHVGKMQLQCKLRMNAQSSARWSVERSIQLRAITFLLYNITQNIVILICVQLFMYVCLMHNIGTRHDPAFLPPHHPPPPPPTVI